MGVENGSVLNFSAMTKNLSNAGAKAVDSEAIESTNRVV